MNYASFTQFLDTDIHSILNSPLELSVSLLTAIAIIVLLLYALVRAVRKSEKLKYEFVTIIAHKFRTPLSEVKWALDEMISSEQEPFIKEGMRNMQQSNENLIELTATLIELADSDSSAKSSYHFEPINLSQFVSDHGDAMKKFFQNKNLYFSVQVTEEEIFVRADRSRLEFVLQALMENAGIYSPAGRNIEIIVSRAGHKAIVTVTDHGIGMEHHDLGRVFSKFFRAKNAAAMDTEGFGVSLYLAQSVMRRHHGKIAAFSAGANQGSTFVVTMPTIKKPQVK